jgi:hypothetical protein
VCLLGILRLVLRGDVQGLFSRDSSALKDMPA